MLFVAQSRAKSVLRSAILRLPGLTTLSESVLANAMPARALTGRCITASFACVNVFLIHACLHYFPEARKALVVPYSILLFLLALVLCVNALPAAGRRAIAEASHFRISPDLLFAIVIITGFLRTVAGLASEFTAGRGLAAAEEFPFLMLFLALADLFHSASRDRFSRAQVYSISELVPTVRMPALQAGEGDATERRGGEYAASVAELRKKQRISLRSGDIVPADSVVVSGQADVLERRNTFANRPAFKTPGAEVFAGTEVREGAIVVQTLRDPEAAEIAGYFERMRSAVQKMPNLFHTPAMLEPVLQALLLSITFGVALFWLGRGIRFLDATSVVIGVAAFAAVARDARGVFWPFRATYSILARRGVCMDNPAGVFSRLRKAKTLMIDYSFADPAGRRGVARFSLLDTRIDETALWSVLLSLFSCSDSKVHKEAAQIILEQHPAARVREVRDVQVLTEDGIAGTIENTHFMIGTEGSLIARKVLFEPADTKNSGEESSEFFFLALERRPVARFVFSPALAIDGSHLRAGLEKEGIRFVLAGTDAEEKLDSLGKSIGLELSSIHGGLSAAGLCERVRAAKPVAFIVNRNTPEDAIGAADVSIAGNDNFFGDISFGDISAPGIVMCGAPISELPGCVTLIRREYWLRMLWLGIGGAILALGVCASAICVLPGLAAAAIASAWSLFPYAVARRLPAK